MQISRLTRAFIYSRYMIRLYNNFPLSLLPLISLHSFPHPDEYKLAALREVKYAFFIVKVQKKCRFYSLLEDNCRAQSECTACARGSRGLLYILPDGLCGFACISLKGLLSEAALGNAIFLFHSDLHDCMVYLRLSKAIFPAAGFSGFQHKKMGKT